MKKIFTIALILILVLVMAVPVYALTPELEVPDMPEIPDISDNIVIELPDDFWSKWFAEHPIKIELPGFSKVVEPVEAEPAMELDTPDISTAKYVHKTPYFGMSKRLEIKWGEVDGAEKYEVLITKANGETISYTVTSNMIYDKAAACPRVYIEDRSTWASATVQVRAISGDVYSEWSDAVKIGCDMIH